MLVQICVSPELITALHRLRDAREFRQMCLADPKAAGVTGAMRDANEGTHAAVDAVVENLPTNLPDLEG